MNGEHPTVHTHETPHNKWWGEVKAKAEECARDVLEGGKHRVTLHEAIGKKTIEEPEDWDDLMDFCSTHGSCGDKNRLFRAATSWIQVHNELEYKRHYPAS